MSILSFPSTIFSFIQSSSPIPLSHTYNDSGSLGAFVNPLKNNCSCHTCGSYREEYNNKENEENNVPTSHNYANPWSQSQFIHEANDTDSDSSGNSDHIAIPINLAPPPPPHRSSIDEHMPLPEIKEKAIRALNVLRLALFDKQEDLYCSSVGRKSSVCSVDLQWEHLDRQINKVTQAIRLIKDTDKDEFNV